LVNTVVDTAAEIVIDTVIQSLRARGPPDGPQPTGAHRRVLVATSRNP